MLAQLPIAYHQMTENRLSVYLAGLPEIAARLGEPGKWRISDVDTGELGIVFLVEGPSGDVCIKQAVAATMDLDQQLLVPLERMAFEEAALTLYGRLAPGVAPRVVHYDSELALLAMERLHPHVRASRALIEGRMLPRLVAQLSRFLADTAFHTSDLGAPAAEKREQVAFFCGNGQFCRANEYLTFVEPYLVDGDRRRTAPQLDEIAREIRGDDALRQQLLRLQHHALTATEALMHGCLTTDAILVTETDAKVVDPAFACYGPIGYDLGMLIGHLLMGYFSQAGLASEDSPRVGYEAWLLGTIPDLWHGFRERFFGLWRSSHAGDAFPPALLDGPDAAAGLDQAQSDVMARVMTDALRFAGVAIIRGTLGRHHASELAAIEDREMRALCERRAIILARELIKDAHYVETIEQVAEVARQIRDGAEPDA